MQAKIGSFLISIYIWAFIVITIFPLFLLYLMIWILVSPFDQRKIVTYYFTVLWTRLYLNINPGWRILVENREKIDRSGNYILVSNHQSIIDIALLLQIRINFKWVSKIELAKVPFVGWVIWMNDHILVRRGDRQSVIQMAEACKKSLSEGISILMFPEGTRSGNGGLQAFKEGAFILAKENGVSILPIVLDGANDALPRKGFWFRVNQIFTIRLLDEIDAETVNRLDLQQLMDYTRNEMAKVLEGIRNSQTV
jgi:1-acyl-sn-glycerol-3-phosphate acyltransferase